MAGAWRAFYFNRFETSAERLEFIGEVSTKFHQSLRLGTIIFYGASIYYRYLPLFIFCIIRQEVPQTPLPGTVGTNYKMLQVRVAQHFLTSQIL